MAYESGIRGQRLEFARETVRGTTPTDPTWLLFSDAVQNVAFSPTASISARGNVGSPDIANFNAGTESHEFSVTYDLQRFFVDAGPDPLDASGDGMLRLADGSLPSSHSVVSRDAAGDLGADGGGSRIYTVATGALINNVELAGDPENGEPIVVTLNYLCENMRLYQVDQPSAGTTLEVVSSSSADTTQTVTIEDDDAGTSEGIGPLTGVTPVTGASSFASIDSISLDIECVGDVTISDGVTDFAIIYGSASYNNRGGDLGMPLLGSGSHGSAIGTGYESILGDSIERPSGTSIMDPACLSSVSMSVDNSIEASSCVFTVGKKLNEGARTVELSATLFSPTGSYDSSVEHLQAIQNNIVWTLTGGTLTLNDAVMTSLGSLARDTGMALMTVDNTFQGKSLTLAVT